MSRNECLRQSASNLAIVEKFLKRFVILTETSNEQNLCNILNIIVILIHSDLRNEWTPINLDKNLFKFVYDPLSQFWYNLVALEKISFKKLKCCHLFQRLVFNEDFCSKKFWQPQLLPWFLKTHQCPPFLTNFS